jgi:transcriptional regulator with XRE-family HTH domain
MSARGLLAMGLSLAALGAALALIGMAWARSNAAYADDVAQLEALRSSRVALQQSVLAARAGLTLHFDDIHSAVVSLRPAASQALLLAERGQVYAPSAEALTRAAQALRAEESAIETFKTDLALLRLSSRYFPSAADALPSPSAVKPQDLNALRSLVERFQEAPARELGQRLEAAISALDTVRATLLEESAEREALTVLLGHARVILDRRERVERITRALLDAPVQAQLEAARSAYERAARQQLTRVMALRLVASELACAGLIALAIGGWRSTRRARLSAPTAPRS